MKLLKKELIAIIYVIFKIEKIEKGRINKFNEINLIINIISKEEADSILDEEINKYITKLRENIDESKKILIEKYDEMLYMFHKLDNGTRRYIENIVYRWSQSEISSAYFTIVRVMIRKSKFKGIKKEEVEELYFDILQNIVDEEITYTRINTKYRKNKEIINNIIEIINQVNRQKRNKLNAIICQYKYQESTARSEQIKCIVYAIMLVIKNYIKKKDRRNTNITEFKNIRLNKK